jgi:Tfp pilus assembly protein PilO
MANSSSAKSSSLLAALLIIVSIVVGYLLLTKYWPAYTLAQGQYTNTAATNTRLKNALASSKTFLSTFESQSEQAAMLDLALPVEDPDMANFVSSISALAQASGVTLTNMQISPRNEDFVAADHAIISQEISLNATGNYLSLKDFILRLEEHFRIIDVEEILVSNSGTAGAGTPPLQIQVKLNTYYQQ